MAVACSGGPDSLALLHVTARMAAGLGLKVWALHVHHGLQAQADAWVEELQTQVAQWTQQGLPVALLWQRLQGQPQPGQSVEAWARAGRYEALQEMLRQCQASLLLLAHHRRDQAETWMLQALRGAGSAGLAAMPAQQWRQGVLWVRPWLQQRREVIEAYIHHHGLRPVLDPSNADPRFARNRLRQRVFPQLLAQFPGAETALCASAQWAQQALALEQEMADLDLAQCAARKTHLNLAPWLALSPARRANALRAWLGRVLGQAAPASLVTRLQAELPALLQCSAQWPLPRGIAGESRVLLFYRGSLSVRAQTPAEEGVAEQALSITGPGVWPVPAWRGAMWVSEVPENAPVQLHERSVPLALLSALQLRPRSGGEQFQDGPYAVARRLKKCWQERGVPALARSGPLLWQGQMLVFVPGLGLDARACALPGASRVALRWVPEGLAVPGGDACIQHRAP
ncbi:tRNA lysidine(34) synthetase TilS [Roseateles sp. BYS180W]|uniref:tRNA(Ile)-lysidine synthase n=1 Tax=Roseateles rivi TaxID=3299028 RepID=A0ABW7FV99_9BURK